MKNRKEMDIPAALLEWDHDAGQWITTLHTEHPERVTLGSMMDVAAWQRGVGVHVEAPPLLDPNDELSEHSVRYYAEQKAEAPPPRAWRVKIVVEYEELPEDEATKWIGEALARDIERQSKMRR